MQHFIIKNTFEKGMSKDLTWVKSNPQSYFESSNFRLLTDDLGKSTGPLSSVKGNEFNFSIPNVGNVYFLEQQNGLGTSLDGTPQSFDLEINGTVVTFNYVASELEDLYTQLKDFINNTPYPGSMVAQSNESGVVLYSSTHTVISSVNASNSSLGIPSPLNAFQQTPVSTDLEIIGETKIRDYAVLFTAPKVTNGSGQIWKVEWDSQDQPTLTLIRNANDDFRLGWDIEARGRYETNSIQRVSWTDDNNDLRSLNILSPTSFMDKISIVPAITYDIPVVQSINQNGGTLDGGWYIYSYKLKVLGGSESAYSRWSAPFPVHSTNESAKQYWEYAGTATAAATTKSLLIAIDNIDTSFTHIDVICGYMKDLTSPVEYFIVTEDKELTGGSRFEFTHSSINTQQTIDENEIFIQDTIFNRCKTITIKDNRLIAGNIKDDTVSVNSFDASATRYLANGTTRGYELTSDRTNPYNKDSNVNLTGAKRRGLYSADQHKYQSNGSTLGGEGPNIKYEFITKDFVLDSYIGFGGQDPNQPDGSAPRITVNSTLSSTTLNGKTLPMGGYWNNFKNPFFASHFRQYMRSETYRFGIVFFDKAGKPLAVKWIDDIRMPEAGEVPVHTSGYYQPVTGHALGVKFTVTLDPTIKARVSGFSIVRAERTTDDETILGQGLMFDVGQKLLNDGSGLNAYLYRVDRVDDYSGYGLALELHTINVPQFLLSNTGINLTGTKIRPVAALSPKASNMLDAGFTTGNNQNPGNGKDKFRWTKYFEVENNSRYYLDNNTVDNIYNLSVPIENHEFLYGQVIGLQSKVINRSIYQSLPVTTGTHGFLNFAVPHGSDHSLDNTSWFGTNEQQFRARGGWTHTVRVNYNSMYTTYVSAPSNLAGQQTSTSRILPAGYFSGAGAINSPSWFSFNHQRKLLFNIYRELDNQYGGPSKSAIESTQYISTGHFQAVTDADPSNTYTCEVFGGDTYINVYDECTHHTNSTAGAFSGVFAFPPDTDEAMGVGSLFIVESKLNLDWRRGQHMAINGTSAFPSINMVNYTDDPDALRNPLSVIDLWQSRENNAVKFLSLSSFSNVTNEWDNRIWASEPKVNGEPINSWSTFKINNFLDVDGNHGPVNKLETFNDTVFYFQDKGFGQVLVNPNIAVQGDQDIEIALGSGKVLHNFKYISTEIGTKHQWSVFTSTSAIYWFDIQSKKAYKFSGQGIGELSDMKGMHSFFTSHVDNYLLDKDSPSLRTGIRGVYDTLNNEALFTFLGSKTVYSNSNTAEFPNKLNSIMEEGSIVAYPQTRNILDDNGNIITTVQDEVEYDVILQYNTSATEFVPVANQNSTYLKIRPSYLRSDFTISYSEPVDAWSTFYNFAPPIYINTKSRLLSPYSLNSSYVYLHNKGDYNKFYGDRYNSVLEVVTNASPDTTKMFNNVQWHTNSRSKSGAKGKFFDQQTFQTYYAYNDYQHTGIQTLDPTLADPNIRRVERNWQIAVPRNVVTETGSNIDILNPANWDLTRTFNDRMRDKYLLQHFEYDNSNSDQFNLNYINTIVATSDR